MYKRFVELLEKYNYKPSDVGKATNISSTVFSEWKSGKSCPNSEKLVKIARFLNTSVEYLVTGEETNIEKSKYGYERDHEFMLYIKRLWDLPPESKQAIYKQIRFEEQEIKDTMALNRKEA